MALTYTDIEEQKNRRIWIFFAVVLLFYFAIAVILANVTKMFFVAQSTVPGRYSPFLSAKGHLYVLLFALAAAVLHSLYSMSNALSFIQKNLGSQKVDTADRYHQRFQNIVEEVNVATGSKYKITPVVVPTVAMNAFAVSDRRKNAIVGVTEGLLSKLTRQQLEAVVAHEAAHVVSGDSFQTTVACSLFGIYAAMLNGLKKIFQGTPRVRTYGRGGGGMILFLFLIYLILQVMQFFYKMIRLFVSRDRELRADAVAVRLTRDPLSLSEALYAISRGWRGFGHIDSSLEALFIINPTVKAVDERDGFWANLFSTHPPIGRRMAALAKMAHADVKNIQEKVVREEKLKERMRAAPPEKKKARWMAMDKNRAWQGPFTIPQMMLLGWVNPGTWVKALESGDVKQAKDEALFQPLFDERIKGLHTSSLDCPRCNQGLVEEEYEGAIVRRCFFCNGCLIEKGKIPRIIIRKEKGFSERIAKMAELTQKNGLEKMRSKVKERTASLLKCPKCGATMVRNFYTMAYLVEVDRCNFCSLVWFDADELEVIQYLIENKQAATISMAKKGG